MITGRWHKEGPPPEECARLWQSIFRYSDDELMSFLSRGDIARTVSLHDERGQLAAAGRMYYHDGAFWLEALAVREDLRGQGYGDLLIRMMLDRAIKHAARHAKLYASPDNAAFFERYGFAQDYSNHSNHSSQSDQPNQPDQPLLMSVPAESISLSGCATHRPSRTSS